MGRGREDAHRKGAANLEEGQTPMVSMDYGFMTDTPPRGSAGETEVEALKVLAMMQQPSGMVGAMVVLEKCV